MTDEATEHFDLELKLLLDAVYLRYHYDFRSYALSSLRRRMRHAMARFGFERVSDLQHRIIHDPAFFAQAMAYFTVQVSEMFRDPGYFQTLREHVVPVLRTYPSIKLWVAGCSSGEEVWSLAILLDEEGLLDRSVIYATDINPAALAQAEQGVFAAERLLLFNRNYQASGGRGALSDYYEADFDQLRFHRRLVSNVVFADHSLATDAVFAEVHMVSCRNVLIYFNPDLQDRAIGLFLDSLVHRGYLGLGSKESLQFGGHADAFSMVRPPHRIYRRLAA